MEILILCGIYLAELVCYLLGLRILFEVQYRRKIWMILGIILPVIIGILPLDIEVGKNTLLAIGIMIIIFISIDGKIVERGVRVILVFLLLESIDGIYVHFCEQILSFAFNQYIECLDYLVNKCCTVINIYLLTVIKENMRNNKEIHINSIIYIIIGIIGTLMVFCLSVLNQVSVYMANKSFAIICNILNLAILVSVFLLVVFVIYMKNTHERMEQLLKTEQLLKESQVNYYRQILKKENDTRKYRHDMVNHLTRINRKSFLHFLHVSSTIKKNVGGCVHATYR